MTVTIQAPAKNGTNNGSNGSNKTYADPLLEKRIAAEWGFIGCVMVGADMMRQECGWLSPSMFWSEERGLFWQKVLEGAAPADVSYEMGYPFYADCDGAQARCNTIYDGPGFARQIARGSYMEQTQGLALQAAQAAKLGDFETVRRLSTELAQMAPTGARSVHDASDVMEAFCAALELEQRNVNTWIPAIDKATAGLERQTESIIAARPSQGKSTLAFQIARNIALHGEKVLFVSLEMSEVNLYARAACPLVGLTWLDVRRGALRDAPHLKDRLIAEAQTLGMALGPNLLIHDKPSTTGDIWAIAAKEKPDVVFVDHLRLVGDKDENEVKRLGAITGNLKQMAKALNLHVCVLAQLNREVDKRDENNRVPVLTDLRDSGQIEENGDLILMLHGEPPPKDGKPRQSAKCDVWMRKARDGQRDVKIELAFDFLCQQFDSVNEIQRHIAANHDR